MARLTCSDRRDDIPAAVEAQDTTPGVCPQSWPPDSDGLQVLVRSLRGHVGHKLHEIERICGLTLNPRCYLSDVMFSGDPKLRN